MSVAPVKPVPAYDLDRDWPWVPVDRDAVTILNRRGNIAVVLGQLKAGDTADASPAEVLARLPAGFPMNSVAAVGRVRTLKEGVERIVRNVIANPHIDTLILLGKDSKVFRPLRGLDCLLRHGVDDDGHVLGPDQDESVLRIFRRDSLVNLTAADIAYFRGKARVRIIADLIDGPATAEEAWTAALPALRGAATPAREPGWGFLEELEIKEWKPPEARRAGNEFTLAQPRAITEFEIVPGVEYIVGHWQVSLTLGLPTGIRAQSIRVRREVNLSSEKFLHAWLLCARQSQLRDSEVCEAAIKVEGAYYLQITPDCGAPPAVIEPALIPFAPDPKGYLIISVDHESERIVVDVFQNKRLGDPATARLIDTIYESNIRKLLGELLDRNYFGDLNSTYRLRLEHIGYIAIMLRRAQEALKTGRRFVQDQPLGPKMTPPNKDGTPAARVNAAVLIDAPALANAPALETAWKQGLASLINDGLQTQTQKGPVHENWCTLFHIHDMGAMKIPAGYPSSEENIRRYAEEFFQKRPEGSDDEYTYGDRMCHFYYDQIENLIRRLKAAPDIAHPGQRYDPWTDLGRPHIPCLAFDVWFLHGGKLHTLQITRSHDIYGAMPQNALGVAKGWATRIAGALDVPLGDLVFLSTSNNFRAADNAAAVAEIVKSAGAVEEKTETSLVRVVSGQWSVVAGQTPQSLGATGGLSASADSCSTAQARSAAEPVKPIAVLYLPDPPADSELDAELMRATLDAELMRATLAAENEIGRRLLRHRDTDQIARFAEHLTTALAKNPGFRTQYGVLSPRDPFEDRDAERADLLSLQLRNQLGRLHAAAVFVNSPRSDRERLSIVCAVQREAARRVGMPAGSVFVVNVRV